MTVVRCVSCGLRQWALRSTCVRCRANLGFSVIEITLLKQDPSAMQGQDCSILPLGSAIRSLRISQKKSQACLASSACLERSNLSRIERSQSVPSVPTLARLLRALGVESLYIRLSKTTLYPTK